MLRLNLLSLCFAPLILTACSTSEAAPAPRVIHPLTIEEKARFNQTIDSVDKMYKASQLAQAPKLNTPSEQELKEIAEQLKQANCQFDANLPTGDNGQPKNPSMMFSFRVYGPECPLQLGIGMFMSQDMINQQEGRLQLGVDFNFTTQANAIKSNPTESFKMKARFDINMKQVGEGGIMKGKFTGEGEIDSRSEGRIALEFDGDVDVESTEQAPARGAIEQITRVRYPDGLLVELKRVLTADEAGVVGKCYLNNQQITDEECVEAAEKLQLPKMEPALL